MSMTLDNVSDESEYNISDRQFFSQSFTVLVKGYIISENDFKVEENPIAANITFTDEGKRPKATIELSEYDPCLVPEENYYIKEYEIDIDVSYCFPKLGTITFTIDEDIIVTGLTFTDESNIVENTIELYINDEFITNNFKADAFENYIPLVNMPDDVTKYNTFVVDEIPDRENKNYKYLVLDDVYYQWHDIVFHDGDEIKIKVSRLNRRTKEGFFTICGYNNIFNDEK
jgi:hypothetical protein